MLMSVLNAKTRMGAASARMTKGATNLAVSPADALLLLPAPLSALRTSVATRSVVLTMVAVATVGSARGTRTAIPQASVQSSPTLPDFSSVACSSGLSSSPFLWPATASTRGRLAKRATWALTNSFPPMF